MKNIILFVEGQSDKTIVEYILKVSKIPSELIEIHYKKLGKYTLMDIQHRLPLHDNDVIAYLMDVDAITIPDALTYAQNIKDVLSMEGRPFELFYAIPEIESWLFADDELILKCSSNSKYKKVIERLPLPDEIPYPKELWMKIFKNTKDFSFLLNMNISRATSRSLSLNDFLTRLSKILKLEIPNLNESISKNLDRRIFINLLKEVLPSNKVIYKTIDGRTYTAKEMIDNIKSGTDVGKEYSSVLLRISRDFLIRKANIK